MDVALLAYLESGREQRDIKDGIRSVCAKLSQDGREWWVAIIIYLFLKSSSLKLHRAEYYHDQIPILKSFRTTTIPAAVLLQLTNLTTPVSSSIFWFHNRKVYPLSIFRVQCLRMLIMLWERLSQFYDPVTRTVFDKLDENALLW